MKIKLDGVAETMLIPLKFKAEETGRESPRIQDKKAVEMVSQIDYDFSKFTSKGLSYTGVIARSVIIDRETKKFLAQNPNAVCICVGCGLDARFYRLDNDIIEWYDLDFEEVINIRRQLLPEPERVHYLPYSALDESWAKLVNVNNRPILIIIEGLLMYFEQNQVKEMFDILHKNFPGATVLAELMWAGAVKRNDMHDTVKKTNAVFRWGVKNGKEVEELCNGVKFMEQWSLNTEMKKYGFACWLFGVIPGMKNCNNSIAVYRI